LAMPGRPAHRPAHGGHVDHASRRGCIRGGRLARHDARDAMELLWPPPSGFSGERGPGHAPETPQKWVNGNRTETHQREVNSRNFNGLADGNFFREQGVGSSNLPAPTNKINDLAFRIPRNAPETAPETQNIPRRGWRGQPQRGRRTRNMPDHGAVPGTDWSRAVISRGSENQNDGGERQDGQPELGRQAPAMPPAAQTAHQRLASSCRRRGIQSGLRPL